LQVSRRSFIPGDRQQLFISEETVRSHAKKILVNLEQPNRTQAVIAAYQAGLIDLD
jgi:DNA-binding NarL/FixJ family response regulator